MKRALVLSGGGSKGAYQFGVWKALRKLNKKIDIVTGTSIGALNGALIVQDDYELAEKMWNNLKFSDVFDKKIDAKTNLFKEYIKAFLKEGGMDVKNFEETVKTGVNLDKFYNSNIDFGLVTFKLNTLTPSILKKSDIKKSMLIDYLIASATCYPAFKAKKIDNDIYIDGGYYDNLPINLAIDMGATDIIAVDLNAVGMIRKNKQKNSTIKYISPRNKIADLLVFDSKEAKRSIRLGYNDTMKEYNKLDGNYYTFSKWSINLNSIIYMRKFRNNVLKNNNPKTKMGKFFKTTIYGDLLLDDKKRHLKIMIEVVESLGKIFNLDDSLIYNVFTFNQEILKILKETPSLNKDSINNLLKSGKQIKILESVTLVKYIYENINHRQDIINLATMFQKEYMAACYLYTLKKHN